MKAEFISISKVKANPNNPRIIKDDKFEKLVKSIKEFPKMLELRPIVVNEDMIVLGGNMRLKACKEAGLKEIPIIKASELTEEQQKEFIIKDNVSFGEWDWDNLANEWNENQLKEWGLDVWVNKNEDELLQLDEEIQETSTETPKITDEGYSLFELVMLHENKLLLLDLLNQIKREFLFEKTEDALMELIRVYQNKNK
jgi:ParB-like chromosome segregation protein Spo0J